MGIFRLMKNYTYWQNIIYQKNTYGLPMPYYYSILFMYFQADNDLSRLHANCMIRLAMPRFKRFYKRLKRAYRLNLDFGFPLCKKKLAYYLNLHDKFYKK